MFKVDILGQTWNVDIHSDSDFCETYPDSEDAGAFCMPALKEMHFNEDDLTLAVVKHELVHAYYDALCVESANLSLDQQEEVFADLFATHGDSMLRLARKMYKHLKEEMNGTS